MSGDLFWLSDGQFAKIAPLLPTKTRGVKRVDDRRVISGIVHVQKSGCRWVDAPEILQPAEHAFDGVSVAVEEGRKARLFLAVGLGRNIGERAPILDFLAQSVGVVALICVDHVAIGQKVEEFAAGRAIGDVSACDQEREGTTVLVRQSVNFGGSATPGTTDRLIFLPPFPPAAERWAFTAEESIITCEGGPPACDNASNKPVHTPFFAHRTKRL